MAIGALQGREFVLKIDASDVGSPTGAGSPQVWVTVADARDNTLSGTTEEVDVTAKDTNGWRDLLEDAGISSLSVSLSGIIKNNQYDGILSNRFYGRTQHDYQMVYPNGRIVQFNALITAYENTAVYNNAIEFSATLVSSGEPTVTGGFGSPEL